MTYANDLSPTGITEYLIIFGTLALSVHLSTHRLP